MTANMNLIVTQVTEKSSVSVWVNDREREPTRRMPAAGSISEAVVSGRSKAGVYHWLTRNDTTNATVLCDT